MRWVAVVLTSGSLAILPHFAKAADPPLLAAFKQFCVDTKADRVAVEAAAIGAGGKPQSSENQVPGIAASASWEVALQGHTYKVSTGTQSPEANRDVQTVYCGVESPVDEDDASISAIRAWAGVPASHSFSDVMLIEIYDFQDNGQQHSALPSNDAAFHELEIAGKVWALGLMRSPTSTNVDLLHTVRARP